MRPFTVFHICDLKLARLLLQYLPDGIVIEA